MVHLRTNPTRILRPGSLWHATPDPRVPVTLRFTYRLGPPPFGVDELDTGPQGRGGSRDPSPRNPTSDRSPTAGGSESKRNQLRDTVPAQNDRGETARDDGEKKGGPPTNELSRVLRGDGTPLSWLCKTCCYSGYRHNCEKFNTHHGLECERLRTDDRVWRRATRPGTQSLPGWAFLGTLTDLDFCSSASVRPARAARTFEGYFF
jgi:hypothetical protein